MKRDNLGRSTSFWEMYVVVKNDVYSRKVTLVKVYRSIIYE